MNIGPGDHPSNWLSTSGFQYQRNKFHFFDEMHDFAPVAWKAPRPRPVIGNDVWIGAGAVVLRGVTIGDGAIVGANSIVTKDVPAYSIVAGAPAKVIRYRFDDSIIERLLNIKWWNMDMSVIKRLNYEDINVALDQLEKSSGAPAVVKYFDLHHDKLVIY